MNPQQIILAMSMQLAETTVERDVARQQVEELSAKIVASEEAKKPAKKGT